MSSNTRPEGGQRPRRRRISLLPRRWWEVLDEAPAAELPFASYFAQLGPRPSKETRPRVDRVVEPVDGWDAVGQVGWGQENELIQDWFEDGEQERLHPICLEAERPPAVSRAWGWVRARALSIR